MSRNDDSVRLRHMLDACRKAVEFTTDRTAGNLEDDEMRLLALLRLLEVIGEAASGVSDDLKSRHPDLPWRQMTATRNRLIHGFFDVDPLIVWNIVTQDIPSLITKIQTLISEQ